MRLKLIALTLAALAAACAAPTQGGPSAGGGVVQLRASRTLAIAIHDEPGTLALHPFAQPGQATYLIKRFANAQLSYLDNEAEPHPYLAEALPELGTDSWKVFPDGRMETTWKLKAGAVWHDGTPLSAQDFVLTWRVYTTPELGQANTTPFNVLDDVLAPDDRTIVLRWKSLYPGAATMYEHNREFPALPRHLVESAFEQMSGQMTADAFLNLPYWTTEYVGLGPFRLDRWEMGQFLEASAFEQHVLGAPRISRVRIAFMADNNAVIASLLAGEILLTGDAAARLSSVPLLKESWVSTGAGAVNLHFNQYRAVLVQFRPEYLEQKALLDARVRAALFHAIDRQAISDSVYGGEAPVGDFLVPPLSALGRAADRVATKYPFDLRISEQLMAEAGFTRGADGIYASPAGGRFTFPVHTQEASDNNAEIAILADGWQRAGFAAEQKLLTGASSRSAEVFATLPALFINSSAANTSLINDYKSTSIPTPQNRWNGSNRGGWSNAEYTALAESFATTLDPRQRTEKMEQMARIFTSELPALTLFYRSVVFAHTSALAGVTNAPPDSSVPWNMHEWELH